MIGCNEDPGLSLATQIEPEISGEDLPEIIQITDDVNNVEVDNILSSLFPDRKGSRAVPSNHNSNKLEEALHEIN